MTNMYKLLVTVSAIAMACPAYADDLGTATSKTSIQQDSNGNYNQTTAHETTDINGNSAGVKTGVNVDANGNATVSKTVKAKTTDAYGNTSKSVSQHVVDTNGGQTTKHIEEETNGK